MCNQLAVPATEGNRSSAFQFSEWMRWADSTRHNCINHPGVYLLGKFEVLPPLPTCCLDKNVIYVGETVDQSLEKRLYQFARSAFQRKYGHSGGWTFSDDFLSGVEQDHAPPWLFVAVLPVTLKEPHRSAYIRFVERVIIWEFVQRWNEAPACNRK